jgi:CopG family transcriptional regulator, nickel-responsive regulator
MEAASNHARALAVAPSISDKSRKPKGAAMRSLTRFSVSLDAEVLGQFDRQIRKEGYPTRSKAVEDLIRDSLVRQEWTLGEDVAGAITLVYDHHRRNLTNRLTDIQHDFHHLIISTQHVHLDHDNCLEIVVVRGKAKEVARVADRLKAVKGIKHASLSMATTGRKV